MRPNRGAQTREDSYIALPALVNLFKIRLLNDTAPYWGAARARLHNEIEREFWVTGL